MINELVQRFKIHLEEDGKSVKIIESYVGDTSALVVFPEGKGVDFNGETQTYPGSALTPKSKKEYLKKLKSK